MGSRLITGILIAVIGILGFYGPVAMAQPGRDAYNSGYAAGLEDGPKDVSPIYIFMGGLLGPFGIAYGLFTVPYVPESRIERIAEEGEDFIAGYRDGYRKAFRNTAMMNGLFGWSSWLLFAIIMKVYDDAIDFGTVGNPALVKY